jgi:hypothetical protein
VIRAGDGAPTALIKDLAIRAGDGAPTALIKDLAIRAGDGAPTALIQDLTGGSTCCPTQCAPLPINTTSMVCKTINKSRKIL